MNPLVPTANPLFGAEYDWVWNGFLLLVSALMFLALVDIMRRASFLRSVEWVALVMLLPVAGPVIWFAYGRNRFELKR